MKQTVSSYAFRRAFEQCRPDNFSYQGLGVLYEYLEQYEQDTGEEIELDVIAICCDYSEATLAQIIDGYEIDVTREEGEKPLTDEEKTEIVREHLEDNGAFVGEVSGGFVYRDF